MTFKFDLSLQWVLSTVGLIIAFLVGLWQYRRAQRQQKIALLLPLITEFETDEEIEAACCLFDYDAGTFALCEQSYTFNNSDLLEAMKVVEWDEDWPPLQGAIRNVMDRYFDFFTKLASFTEIGLLSFRDLRYFYYYFELLVGIEKYKGAGFDQALNRYLESYRFGGCRKCLDAYRKLPPSLKEELQLTQQS